MNAPLAAHALILARPLVSTVRPALFAAARSRHDAALLGAAGSAVLWLVLSAGLALSWVSGGAP